MVAVLAGLVAAVVANYATGAAGNTESVAGNEETVRTAAAGALAALPGGDGSSGGGEGSSVGEFDGTYTLSTPLIFLGNNSNESAFSLIAGGASFAYGFWDLYLAPRATDGWDAQMGHPHVEALAQQVSAGSYLTFEVGMNPEETYEFVALVDAESQFNCPDMVNVYTIFDNNNPYTNINETEWPNLMVCAMRCTRSKTLANIRSRL